MAVKILSSKMFSKKMKLTIHKTGRLGFNEEAVRVLRVVDKPCFTFGLADGKPFDEGLLIARHDEQNPDGFKTLSSGKNFYLNTAALFDMYDLNYRNVSFIYDLNRAPAYDEDMKGETYTMHLRTRARNSVKNK